MTTTAKKKRPMTDAERMQKMRDRRAQDGKKQVTVTLPVTTITKLDKLVKSTDQSRSEVVEQLIKNSGVTTGPVTVDGLKARDKSSNIHRKVRRFRELHRRMDSGNLTKKQLQELEKLSSQIALAATET